MDISLLISMCEESTHRATVVNICFLEVYMVLLGMVSFSLGQVENILFLMAILWLLKEPLTLFWVSTVYTANFKRMGKERLAAVYKKSAGEHHGLQESPIQSDEGNHQPGIKIVRFELNIEELRKSEEAKRRFQWSIQRFFQSAKNQELGQYNTYSILLHMNQK